ncbi:putative cytochrome P450 [Lyophyllum shimeji]|uniref:Cytochrome P450 n=1 Tax=Lyophyllum shimeji TaxID=47721 RepID=A0A9P3PMA6_LYOSH|nr:putative cytochrome P450 [Lyophyllum shimeji]
MSLTLLASAIATIYVTHRLVDYWRAARSINNHPGYRTLLAQTSSIGHFFPPIPGITPGGNHLFMNKYRMYEIVGCDIHSAVSAWPTATTTLFVADAAAIKQVALARTRFQKPVHHYDVLELYGRNLITAEGDEWKKYRKICAPAFSERNNRLVWEETIKIMDSLFEDVWGSKEIIATDHVVEITLPIALFVIGAAGFGRKISWKDGDLAPPGHRLTFKEALHVVSTDVFIKLVVPDRALGLTERLRSVKVAFEELKQYMLEMIDERQRAGNLEGRHDLLSSLLNANDLDSGESKLTVSELLGNIFIFLLAGHETTAHTLCFTFALLALHPDEQEILYQHTQSVLSRVGDAPTYDNMPLFTQSLAVFYETLRMFPPATGIMKTCMEDTTLATTDALGNQIVVPVPKGADVTMDFTALHYNPRYWDEPHAFRPSRFLKEWPRDAFLPFSTGARACLGRKFFETEGIAILTKVISRYRIEVKEEPQFALETFEQRKARIFKTRLGLTLTPIKVPLVFKLRETKTVT